MIKKISLREFYRLIFVLFSLYLMRDAFYRWDGFSYYASFSEFLPTVALALILWSIVSVFTAISLWMLFKLFELFCNHIGIEIEHLLLYACISALSGALVWKGKKLIWPYVQTTFQIKLVVFLCISIVSIFAAWLFRDKARKWISLLNQSIAPLSWLFAIFVVLSVPLVAYSTWGNGSTITESKNTAHNFSVDNDRPNIILVTFDALAARNMSVYGYHRETTPFIRKWSKNAAVFTMAEASSNFTTPAVASLMTGKRVWTHQTYHIEGSKPVKSKVESLPALLKDHGYFNIALVVNPFASVKVLGMSDSFDIAPQAIEFGDSASLFGWKFGVVDKMLYRVFGDKIRMHNWIIRNDFILSRFINLVSRNIYQTPVPPEKAFDRFIDIIDGNLPKPFFAWIHIFPPHDPYLPPEPFKGSFNSSSELRAYKKQEKLVEKSYEYLFNYLPLPDEMRPSVNLMRDYYDENISYIDKSFEDFIEKLDERKIGNNVIILSADHGESFEHGYFTHGGPFLYEQVTHIPLTIKEPGEAKGQTINNVVEQIDVTATILDMANIPVPLWMEGRSLVPLIRGEDLSPRPAFAMNFEQNRSSGHKIATGSVAVWNGDYKLIQYLQREGAMLFDLKKDPYELDNIVYREPETAQRLLGLIKEHLEKANKRIIRPSEMLY